MSTCQVDSYLIGFCIVNFSFWLIWSIKSHFIIILSHYSQTYFDRKMPKYLSNISILTNIFFHYRVSVKEVGSFFNFFLLLLFVLEYEWFNTILFLHWIDQFFLFCLTLYFRLRNSPFCCILSWQSDDLIVCMNGHTQRANHQLSCQHRTVHTDAKQGS